MDINSSDSQDLLNQLQKLTQLTLDEDFRMTIPEKTLCLLLETIRRKDNQLLVVECLRILRNCAGQNWSACQKTWNQLLCECTHQLRNMLIMVPTESVILLIRLFLQFIANMLNTEPGLSTSIWEDLQSQLRTLILYNDEKIHLYTSSVFYALLKNSSKIMEDVTTSKWIDIATAVVESSHKGVEFSQLIIQLYMKSNTLEIMYEILEPGTRLLLLFQISEFISNWHCEVDLQSWSYFSRKFLERANIILRTCETSAIDSEAMEVAGLVEILAKGSSNDACRYQLLLDDELLLVTIDLLRNIHRLGKAGSNYFSSTNDHFVSVEPHPALNLKCNLIRLIGNLCYKCPKAQDCVRQLEAIALLLECCNLDARNPFIQQWSVLAIRNLCKNNLLNQEVIDSMTRKGIVQPSILQNVGLEIQEMACGLTVQNSFKSE